MKEYIYHTVDAGHIRNIGEQSVSNKIQAILELVKNAYDADSHDCTVTFSGVEENGRVKITAITIADHGIGMTKNDLRDKFMKVGTGTKIEESFSPKLGRRVSGEKGMGHYSAQRLGDKIAITATPDLFDGRQFSREDNATYVLELDWSKYVQGEDFGKIPNTLHTTARREPGTVIEISNLRDSWTTRGKSNDLETLAKNLGSVMLPKSMQSEAKDKFDARIKLVGFEAELPKPQGSLLDCALYKIQASLQGQRIKFQILRRKKGSNVMSFIEEDRIRVETATCGNARITIHWFPGAVSDWAEGVMKPRLLREQLLDNHGIKIYNDKIRVMPYGEEGNDWLGLGTRKSGPESGGMVRNVHLVGFLRLSRKNNPCIMETTTRQALRENSAFKSLKDDFVIPVIDAMERCARKIAEEEEDLGKKVHHFNTAESEIKRLKRIAKDLPLDTRNKDSIDTALNKVSRHMALQEKEYYKKEEGIFATLEMYRNLSTAGIQTIAFSHEIMDPVNLVKATLTNLVENHASIEPEKRLKYLQSCLNKIVSLISWATHIKEFSSLLAGPDVTKKQRSIIKIEDSLQKIRRDMLPVLDALSITMHEPIILGNVPDILMNKASFDSIFLNLISNSARSLKKVNRRKTIRIVVSKDDTSIRIEFEDNGYGMDENTKDKIFRPFFTTYKDDTEMGTGMGLTIVKEIVDNEYHGKVILAKTVSEKTHPGKGMAKFLVRLPPSTVTIDQRKATSSDL